MSRPNVSMIRIAFASKALSPQLIFECRYSIPSMISAFVFVMVLFFDNYSKCDMERFHLGFFNFCSSSSSVELCLEEVCAPKVCVPEVCAPEVCVPKVCVPEVCVLTYCFYYHFTHCFFF